MVINQFRISSSTSGLKKIIGRGQKIEKNSLRHNNEVIK